MNDQNILLKNLRSLAPKHCDNCGNKYMPQDFKILKSTETNALMHLTCVKCANTYVINAYLNDKGMGSQRMPLVVDLVNTTEIEKFATTNPVSKNNAVDLYNFLNENRSIDKLFPANTDINETDLDNNLDSNIIS